MDHTFRSPRSSRGVHDEQRMAEWELLKLQLRKLVQLATSGCQKVIYKYTKMVTEKKEKSDKVTTLNSTSCLYINVSEPLRFSGFTCSP